jgi:hypothetical protein
MDFRAIVAARLQLVATAALAERSDSSEFSKIPGTTDGD